jgi:hypothetical protein
MIRRPSSLASLLALILGLSLSSPAHAGLGGFWWTGFGPEGIDGRIHAIAIDNGSIVAAGEFTRIGHVPANHVARWNGASWEPLGPGIDENVNALAIHQGTLVAALEGGALHSWNGAAWSLIAEGNPSGVQALASWNGLLVAGGSFPSHLQSWDGVSWSPFASGLNGSVRALFAEEDALLTGGSFTSAGGPALHIARWDGAGWSSSIPGVPGTVESICTLQGAVIVGGIFPSSSPISPSPHLLRWNGAEWNSISPAPNASVLALAVSGSSLFAGGGFTWAGETSAAHVASWIGDEWSSIDGSFGGHGLQGWTVFDLARMGDDLFAAGLFEWAGKVPASGFARWDGTEWTSLSSNGTIFPKNLISLGSMGAELVACGNFVEADSVIAQKVASWNGVSWEMLGVGINSYVWGYEEYAGQLTIGGVFTTAGGACADHVAGWDGVHWSTLGTQPPSGPVFALQEYQGDLFAGGSFAGAGGTPTSGIARWNGSSWIAVHGAGALGGDFCEVTSFAIYNGDLIVAGDFTSIDGVPARSIARWDGSSWSALGPGIDGHLQDVKILSGEIVAAGVPGIFRWDGASWTPLEGFTGGSILALATHNDALFAGGSFQSAGGNPSFLIARWDGLTALYAPPSAAHFLMSNPAPNPTRTSVSCLISPLGHARVSVFDVAGREVRTLFEGEAERSHVVRWDCRDQDGSDVAPGIYFLRLDSEAGSVARRLVRLR